MNNILKYAGVITVAGAMALAAATPSQARGWRTGAAVAGGFVAGAAVGAAVANSNNYYYGGPGYGYYDPGYAYGPGYAYDPAPAYDYGYAYSPAPTYYYNGPRYRASDSASGGASYGSTSSVNQRSQ
jgi:hypothetical protein